MREILFRGKRKDNGEWVYGYLIIRNSKPCIWFETIDEFCQTGSWYEFVEVIPETIGQFTGLTDKNGTKIFEGDIVSFQDYTGCINFDDNDAMFTLEYDENICTDFGHYYGYDCEVIGNIHDNPEVLKVKE